MTTFPLGTQALDVRPLSPQSLASAGTEQDISASGALAVSQPSLCYVEERNRSRDTSKSYSDLLATRNSAGPGMASLLFFLLLPEEAAKQSVFYYSCL